MRRPTVTVLVPAHDEAKTIVHVLDQLKKQDYPIAEIFVVADACSDNTAELARLHGVTRVWETDLKDKAGAQNVALPFVATDVVVGFDGDSWPADERTVGLMVEDLERHGWDATCGTILPAQQYGWDFEKAGWRARIEGHIFTGSRNYAYALGRRWWRLCQAKVGRIQVLTGACYAFRTDAIKSIGGFPNGLITADMDATWRLHSEGYKLGYSGDSITHTIDPEDFKTYRNQMRRWSSGYYQNMAKHRGQMKHWRSLLVVGTAIFDLVLLFAYSMFLMYSLVTWSNHGFLKSVALWTLAHWVVSTALVSSVIGWKKALAGLLPYTLVNFYNKWLYFTGFVREWILGRHYAAWTGRQGRKVEITAMTRERKYGLTVVLMLAGSLAETIRALTVSSEGDAGTAFFLALAAFLVLPFTQKRGKRAAPKKPRVEKGRHARTSSAPSVVIPQQRVNDVPVKVLYDPEATSTTELPIPPLRNSIPR